MADLHIGHHIVQVTQSFIELGLVEVIWTISAISVAVLAYEWFFT